jgi:hypothetical protein
MNLYTSLIVDILVRNSSIDLLLPALQTYEPLRIIRKKYKHLLGDVIILPEKRKKSIIDSVILNLKSNYADKLYQCEAFYREVKYEEKSKQYSRLIEAAINIQDKKINSSLSKIKCSILEFRKSNNYTKEHWGSKFIKKLIDYPDNKLQTLLERNPIRSYFTNKQLNKFNPLKHIKENKTNSLSLEKVIQNNKQDIYIFTYLHSTLYTYTIYINKQDYAIVRFDIELNSGKSPIHYSSYSYKRLNNKYYPIYFSSKAIEDYLSNSKGLGWYANSLSFVNYSTDRKNFNRLRSKYLIPKDLDLYKQVKEYHPHFWENYNILLEEPINQKIVTDLESEKEIEKQFQNNSMK